MNLLIKTGIVIACSAIGIGFGYGLFLFVSLAQLAYYGDDGQNGHLASFLQSALFYGTFGTPILVGFFAGLTIVKKR